MKINRRNLLAGIAGAGGAMFLSKKSQAVQISEKAKEISALEDLMREHGILRRVLFVYSEIATRLRSDPSKIPADALPKTAKLFRSFGDDYHEKKLEETFIFPALKKAGGHVADLTDILIAQHQRGREITDFVLAKTQKDKIEDAVPLSQTLEPLVRMYRAHAAREDTIIFPAWKQILTAEQLDEMAEKFEDIEHEIFGEDGFNKAERQISDIEKELGLAGLDQFTAPPPPW